MGIKTPKSYPRSPKTVNQRSFTVVAGDWAHTKFRKLAALIVVPRSNVLSTVKGSWVLPSSLSLNYTTYWTEHDPGKILDPDRSAVLTFTINGVDVLPPLELTSLK